MHLIPTLKNQTVRDLAWSCFGPNLVDDFAPLGGTGQESCQLELTAERQQWLLALDKNPAELLQQLSVLKSTRVGIYFEALWIFPATFSRPIFSLTSHRYFYLP